jgi:hypothetical protein
VHTPFETPDNVFPLQWNGREWESIPRGDAPYAEAGEGQVFTVGPEGLPDAPSHDRGLWGASGETPPVAPDSRFFRHEEINDANEIRDIQERINETEYGPIEVDGSAKDETWGAIGRVAAGYGAPKPSSLTDAYPLILGARQEPLDVRDIQTVLMRDPASAEIMEGWGADGDYGPLTERALETAFPGYDAPPNTREPTPDELMEIWRSRLMRRRAP